MNSYLRAAVVSILVVTTNTSKLVQAQNAEPPRKPMAESSLELPEYFGLYAVQESGQMLALDQPVQRLDERPTLTLPANVEFLVYGKDVDPSTLHLIVIPTAQPQRKQEQGNKQFSWDDFMQQTQVDGPENFMASMSGIPRGSAEGKLLVKPVGNQPQMLRLIPAGLLPNGIYQIGTPEKSWYRFVVGPMPAQSGSQQTGTAQQPTRRAQSSQGDNVRTITLGDIMGTFNKPDDQGTLTTSLQNHPAALSYRELNTGNNEPRIYTASTQLTGVPYDAAWSALLAAVVKPAPTGERMELRAQDKIAGSIECVQFVDKARTLFITQTITLKKTTSDAEQSQVQMDMQLSVARRLAVKKADIIKGFAELMDVAKGAASAPSSDVVSLVCRGAKLGEFRHGTRCTGYYGADGLVDIQLSGVASALPHEQKKELVHAGVDIIAGEGWKITPIRDGIVTDVISEEVDKDWRSLGYMVIVQHSADLESPMYSCYLHMRQAPSVKIGDAVMAGKTLLGRVGQTGAAFGSHIHVEVRTFKDRYNPAWKNIYGKLTPESEKTFDEHDFSTSWVDPVKFALQ